MQSAKSNATRRKRTAGKCFFLIPQPALLNFTALQLKPNEVSVLELECNAARAPQPIVQSLFSGLQFLIKTTPTMFKPATISGTCVKQYSRCLQRSSVSATGLRLPQRRYESSSRAPPASPLATVAQNHANPNPPTRNIGKMIQVATDLASQNYTQNSPEYHLHVYSHKHNTHITLTGPERNPLVSLSCGNIGFKKSARKSFDAAHQLTAHTLSVIQEKEYFKDIKALEIVMSGFGVGREAFTKALLGTEGKNLQHLITTVTDSTKLKFGGTRSRETRRLG